MRLSTPLAFFLLLCTGTSLAAQVKFLPDTVCAGNKGSCTTTSTKVVTTGSKSIVIRLYYLLSPLSTTTQLVFDSKALPDYTFWRAENPPLLSSKGYRFSLTSWSPQRDTIPVKPGDTLTFSNFKFGECFNCTSVLSRTAATPTRLGNGERVGLLFGTDSTHLDTLWAIANKWISGGTLPHGPSQGQSMPRTSHDASGRQWTTGTAATIEFTPIGSSLPDTP